MTIRRVFLFFVAALMVTVPGGVQAIERAPRDPNGAVERATKFAADGQWEAAVGAYTEAVEADGQNWRAFSGRASAYNHLQLPALAEADNDHAVEIAPGVFEPVMARGLDRFLKRRYAEAVRDFETAIRIKPDKVEPYHWRGSAYVQLEQGEKAIADFTQVIDHDPERVGLRGMECFNRAIAEQSIGKLDDALADYDLAEKAGQASGRERAECLLDLKRWAEAEEIYSDVLRTTDEKGAENEKARYDALRNRAVALTGQKLYDRAEADLAEAFAMQPGNIYAYGTASWTRLFAGKVDEAKAAALKALGADANQLWIQLNLAHAYLLSGHFEWAKAIYVQDKDQRGAWGKNGAEIALQDLKDLREAGIENPELARGEEFLRGLMGAKAERKEPGPAATQPPE